MARDPWAKPLPSLSTRGRARDMGVNWFHVFLCDVGWCGERMEVSATSPSMARYQARATGWTWDMGRNWWLCPDHARNWRPGLHEAWCPWETRQGPCACQVTPTYYRVEVENASSRRIRTLKVREEYL